MKLLTLITAAVGISLKVERSEPYINSNVPISGTTRCTVNDVQVFEKKIELDGDSVTAVWLGGERALYFTNRVDKVEVAYRNGANQRTDCAFSVNTTDYQDPWRNSVASFAEQHRVGNLVFRFVGKAALDEAMRVRHEEDEKFRLAATAAQAN